MKPADKLVVSTKLTPDTGWTAGERCILEGVGRILFEMKLCNTIDEGETDLGEPWVSWGHDDISDPVFSIAKQDRSFICHAHGFTFVAMAPSMALLVSKVWPMFSQIIT